MFKKSAQKIKDQEISAQKALRLTKNHHPSFFKRHKKLVIVSVIIIILLIIGGLTAFFILSSQSPDQPAKEPEKTKTKKPKKYYSDLTGEEIKNPDLAKTPTFCVQIPNGMDGPRPQAGLAQAGVVFEAIAEAGITRFAAIFQNPTASAIGPIRSLRPYYLDWDIPFDCTVVHAGGSYEALANLRAGGYKDLDESRTYMWRSYGGYWAPNNLFTSSALLKSHATDFNNATSDVHGFSRLTPEKAEKSRKSAQSASKKSENPTPLTTYISLKFGSVSSFNVNYSYDAETNSYARAYDNGQPHLTYTCPDNLEKPRPKVDCGEPIQVSPKVVIAMMVDEWLASDRYHHVITTLGSGPVFIFQNGTIKTGTWKKESSSDQLKFKDDQGKTIKLIPGQTWVTAIPKNTGSVNY